MRSGITRYSGRRLLAPGADPREVSGITRSDPPGPVLYLTGTLAALVNADASLVIFALIARSTSPPARSGAVATPD